MSRIGNKPVAIISGVKVSLKDGLLAVEGPKGKLELRHDPLMKVVYDDQKKVITVARTAEDPHSRAIHGLTRSLINNMIEGASKGYEIGLEVHGVGYTAKIEGANIVLSVGFCNPVKFPLPKTLKVATTVNAQDKNVTDITISGPDKQLVGQFAAVLRKARPPEPYKQKGIRYKGENVLKKQGKAFAGGG